jgi:rare lipoprotein A
MHGSRTANGEKFNPNGLTAAHKTLPFGTILRVTNPDNGRSIVVRINDRGPFTKGVDLDIARGGAQELGLIQKGRGKVFVEELIPSR